MKYPIEYPIGFVKEDGSRQIVISFPFRLFRQIVGMAQKEKIDLNTMVLELIACGKLCLDESDKLERVDNERER